jgi:acylphosphatase
VVDLLNEKTIEFLRTISKKSPETTVFVAYAHDNHEEGTASAPQVQGIIRLLNKIGVITVTDLTRELSSTTGRRETNANRDVLQDQFCLLPNDADRRNRHFLSSVSHVVICGSELLGTYCSSPLAIEYFRCLRECYNESTATHKSFTDIKSNLLDVMKDFQERKGFHHVLTEIAFSEIRFERAAEFGVDHGIVPLVMNGQDVNYIPFCAKSEPIRIAFQRPSSLPLPPSQARMKATLKILGHIYNLPNTQVKCVEEFYDECVGQLCHLSNSGGTSATADFILTESRTTQNELHTIMQKEMEDCKLILVRYFLVEAVS